MRDNLQIYALGLDPNDVQNTELMKEIKQALERENTMVFGSNIEYLQVKRFVNEQIK